MIITTVYEKSMMSSKSEREMVQPKFMCVRYLLWKESPHINWWGHQQLCYNLIISQFKNERQSPPLHLFFILGEKNSGKLVKNSWLLQFTPIFRQALSTTYEYRNGPSMPQNVSYSSNGKQTLENIRNTIV